jgi:hypothetical protein
MGKYITDEDQYQYLAIIPIHMENSLMNECLIKYDFNRDVWSRTEELRTAIPNILRCLTYSAYKNEISPQNQKVEETNDSPEDQSITDGIDSYAAQIVDDDDGYTVVGGKRPKKRLTYSTHCIYNFRCSRPKCSYMHTDKEKEFFKAVKDFRIRHSYKTMPCIRADCPNALKSYLCSYAHGQQEFYCRSCKTTGDHLVCECPNAP